MLSFLIAWLASKINCHQAHVIAYLREENRILKTKLKGKRIQLTGVERRRLAVLAHPIERKNLKDISSTRRDADLERSASRGGAESPDLPKGNQVEPEGDGSCGGPIATRSEMAQVRHFDPTRFRSLKR
jgi:hypothetical protein